MSDILYMGTTCHLNKATSYLHLVTAVLTYLTKKETFYNEQPEYVRFVFCWLCNSHMDGNRTTTTIEAYNYSFSTEFELVSQMFTYNFTTLKSISLDQIFVFSVLLSFLFRFLLVLSSFRLFGFVCVSFEF